MPEPLTLALVAGAALQEGIKFLYGQANEVINRWRARRETATQESAAHAEQAEPAKVALPAVFEGQLSNAKIHFNELDKVVEPLADLSGSLTKYGMGIAQVDKGDEKLLRQIDALRQLLELVYQQPITFRGEERPNPTTVTGRVEVDRVMGSVAAVFAGEISGADVHGEVKAGTVEGGELYGVKADRIG